MTTQGEAAHGVVLQSVGGSGGLAGAGATQIPTQPPPPGSLPPGEMPLTPPSSAGVDIYLGGGENSRGNGGDVTLTDAGPQGYGVWAEGGDASNSLTIAEGGSLSAVSGNVIYSSGGAVLTVANSGEVTGNVVATTFNNETTGTFATGSFVNGSVVDGGVTSIANALPGTVGALAVSGTYHQLSTSTIEFGIETLSLFDTLGVIGEATFEGYVNLWFLEGYAPALGDTFNLITAREGTVFDFANIALQNLASGYAFTEFTTTDGLVTTFGIQITAVPEPTVFPLVGGTLAALVMWRRRRAG